jgi:hypothetical protein
LPLEPFRYYQYGERTVHLDGWVEVEAAYCSAPPRLRRDIRFRPQRSSSIRRASAAGAKQVSIGGNSIDVAERAQTARSLR